MGMRRLAFCAAAPASSVMDKVSSEERSRTMARVRSANTGPEKKVRSLLHSMGLRFRLWRRDLPGSPDIVLPRRKTAVFVHGCFWHRHPDCRRATMPASNVPYWERKFQRTVARDQRAVAELEADGWRVVIIWECELKDLASLRSRLEKIFFGEPAQEDSGKTHAAQL